MKQIIDVNEYRKINYNYVKTKVIALKIIFMFLTIIFIILTFIKFDLIYSSRYIVQENSIISTNIDDNNLNKITNNKYIYISNKKYKYKIISIENKIDNTLMIKYNTIYLKIENYKDSTINNIIYCDIKYDKKTVFEIIISLLFKEGDYSRT